MATSLPLGKTVAPAVDPDRHPAEAGDRRRSRRSRSRTSAVWLSTPRTNVPGGQLPLQHPQPALAHVAEAGVVVAALGVVVVGDDRGPQAGRRPEQVEPVAASAGRLAHLVDLVDGDRDGARG